MRDVHLQLLQTELAIREEREEDEPEQLGVFIVLEPSRAEPRPLGGQKPAAAACCSASFQAGAR